MTSSTSPNDFWLAVHSLAVSLECEGLTRGDRSGSILDEWERMPAMARSTVAQELTYLLTELPELEAALRLRQIQIATPADDSEASV